MILLSSSSVSKPQEPEDFERERLETVKSLLSVPEVRPVVPHDETLLIEMETCDNAEHTANSLPFILHQVSKNISPQIIQDNFVGNLVSGSPNELLCP